MADPRALRAQLDRVTLELARLRSMVGDDAESEEPDPVAEAVERLRDACRERGIDVVDSTVAEADAGRLIGRSTSSLRRWREEGRGPVSRRYLARISHHR